jgi:hypothetical protein
MMHAAHTNLRSTAPLALRTGDTVALAVAGHGEELPVAQVLADTLPDHVPAGSRLETRENRPVLQITGSFWMPRPGAPSGRCYWARALDRAELDESPRPRATKGRGARGRTRAARSSRIWWARP